MRVLVTAASEHGATGEIAQAIAKVLSARGLEVTVTPVEGVQTIGPFDAVVLGSMVYAGHRLKSAKELVDRNSSALAERAVWLFSSGPVGDPRRKLVQKMGEDPVDLLAMRQATGAREHRMFAGKLDKRQLKGTQRLALTIFRGLQGDFRDWGDIERWASGIADSLNPRG